MTVQSLERNSVVVGEPGAGRDVGNTASKGDGGGGGRLELLEYPRSRGGDILASGFGMTAAVWIAAYICRLPFLLLPAQVTISAMLVAVLVGGFVAARYSAKGFWCALWAGALSGFLDLLIVGSLMEDYVRKHPGGAGSAVPESVYWVVGSIGLNAVVAGIGGAVGRFVPSRRRGEILWTQVFSFILVALTFMLIGAGGLVTANHAGLAVPDWPTSYKYNMFLLPFSIMQQTGQGADAGIFYEHAHRLIASLVGFTSLALAIYLSFAERRRTKTGILMGVVNAVLVIAAGVASSVAIVRPGGVVTGAAVGLGVLAIAGLVRSAVRTARSEPRGWVIDLAWIIGFGVLVQAILGGTRVTETSVALAIVHGVFAQLVFATMAVLAAATGRSFYTTEPRRVAGASSDRGLTALLVAAMAVQLTLGALVRHENGGGYVMIHITMAVMVSVLILACGFRSWGLHGDVRPLRRWGIGIMWVVLLQLILGVLALTLWAGNVKNAPIQSAVSTTLHQMNGALLLATSAVLAMWTWRLLKPLEGAGE
ncbi:MAG: COX15/CtaA family protein [Phycisphaerae bacterium]